eukprot:gene7006-109_t
MAIWIIAPGWRFQGLLGVPDYKPPRLRSKALPPRWSSARSRDRHQGWGVPGYRPSQGLASRHRLQGLAGSQGYAFQAVSSYSLRMGLASQFCALASRAGVFQDIAQAMASRASSFFFWLSPPRLGGESGYCLRMMSPQAYSPPGLRPGYSLQAGVQAIASRLASRL